VAGIDLDRLRAHPLGHEALQVAVLLQEAFPRVSAVWRAQSMKSCAAGPSIRFFNVTMPVARERGLAGSSTGNILNGKCLPSRGRRNPGGWLHAAKGQEGQVVLGAI